MSGKNCSKTSKAAQGSCDPNKYCGLRMRCGKKEWIIINKSKLILEMMMAYRVILSLFYMFKNWNNVSFITGDQKILVKCFSWKYAILIEDCYFSSWTLLNHGNDESSLMLHSKGSEYNTFSLFLSSILCVYLSIDSYPLVKYLS